MPLAKRLSSEFHCCSSSLCFLANYYKFLGQFFQPWVLSSIPVLKGVCLLNMSLILYDKEAKHCQSIIWRLLEDILLHTWLSIE